MPATESEKPPTPRTPDSSEIEPSLRLASGRHVLHLYYRIDRARLHSADESTRADARQALISASTNRETPAPEQLQFFVVPGQKADFGLVAADPDPLRLHNVQLSLEAGPLGSFLSPAYSFTSITEVSEYVPDAEQYAAILRDREKMDPESPIYRARVAQYANRLAGMNRQRLEPEFPDWPVLCFYPMNKLRLEGQNWYMLPFEERSRLMAEHGQSGMKFAGRVSQLITASTGLDDWEWGVTLWAKNPAFLKEIVYTMRFDEASARYAQFGPFYQGYVISGDDLCTAIRL
jgi:chlorite dismutase